MNIFPRTLFIILTGEPGKSFEIRGLLNIFARNFFTTANMFKGKSFLVIAILAAAFSSCMNPAYDLTNGIDTTIRIDGDISAPIGSTEMVFIEDFLHLINLPFTPEKDYHSTDNYEIKGWNETINGENVTFEIDMLTLKADLENHVPMRFVLTAEAIDTEGNTIPEITTELNAEILAGTLNDPTVSPISIIVSGNGDISRMDGVRLLIESYAPGSDLLGTPLDPAQGVRMLNIKARIQGKADIEL